MNPRLALQGHAKDLGGGFDVRRLLPSRSARQSGPSCSSTTWARSTARPGDDPDVRPHPHIGLATVTYLFEGAIIHRDSLGTVQRIQPGAVNWMTAGRGIVHSERTPGRSARQRRVAATACSCGWRCAERRGEEPSLRHTPAARDPDLRGGGARVRVLVGAAWGATRRWRRCRPRSTWTWRCVPATHCRCRAPRSARVYGVDGGVEVDGEAVPAGTMVVLAPGEQPLLGRPRRARVVLIGGAAAGPPPHLVELRLQPPERIVQAQDDWAAQRFGRAGRDRIHPATDRRPAQPARCRRRVRSAAAPGPAGPVRERARPGLSTTMAFMPKVTAPSRRASGA